MCLIGVSKTTHAGNNTEDVVIDGENVKFGGADGGVCNVKDGVIDT